MRHSHALVNRNFLCNVSFQLEVGWQTGKKLFGLWILRLLLPRGWFCNNSWLFEGEQKQLRGVTVSSKNNDWKVDCVRFFSLKTNCFSTHSGYILVQSAFLGAKMPRWCKNQLPPARHLSARETSAEKKKTLKLREVQIKSSLCLPRAVFDGTVNYKKMPLRFRRNNLSLSVKSPASLWIADRAETEDETQDSLITAFSPDIFSIFPLRPFCHLKQSSPFLPSPFIVSTFNFLGLSHKRRWKVLKERGKRGLNIGQRKRP